MNNNNGDELLNLLKLLRDDSGTGADKLCVQKLNEVLPKLITSQLCLESEPQVVSLVLQVVGKTICSLTGLFQSSLSAGVIARILQFLPETRFFVSSPSFASDLVYATTSSVSLLQSKDSSSYNSFLRGILLLSQDVLSVMQVGYETRNGNWKAEMIEDSTAVFPSQLPSAQIQSLGEFLTKFDLPVLNLNVQTVGNCFQILEFCISTCGSLIEKFPHDSWIETHNFWSIIQRTFECPFGFYRISQKNSALKSLLVLLSNYKSPLENSDGISVSLLNLCKLICEKKNSLGIDIKLLSECITQLYNNHLPPISIGVNCEALIEIILKLSDSVALQLRNALFDILKISAKTCWMNIAPKLPLIISILFPSEVQFGIFDSIREIIIQYAIDFQIKIEEDSNTEDIIQPNIIQQQQQQQQTIAIANAPSTTNPNPIPNPATTPLLFVEGEPQRKKSRQSIEEQTDHITGNAINPACSILTALNKPLEEASSKFALNPIALITEIAETTRPQFSDIQSIYKTNLLISGLIQLFFIPPVSLSLSSTPFNSQLDLYRKFVDKLSYSIKTRPLAISLLVQCTKSLLRQTMENIKSFPKDGLLDLIDSLVSNYHSIVLSAKPLLWSIYSSDIATFLISILAPQGFFDTVILPSISQTEQQPKLRNILENAAETLAFFPNSFCPSKRIGGFQAALKSKNTQVVLSVLRSLPVMIAETFQSNSLFDLALPIVLENSEIRMLGYRYFGFCVCAMSLPHQIETDERVLTPYEHIRFRNARFTSKLGFPWWVNFGEKYFEDTLLVPECQVCDCSTSLSPEAFERIAASSAMLSIESFNRFTHQIQNRQSFADINHVEFSSFMEALPRLLAHTKADLSMKVDKILSYISVLRLPPNEKSTDEEQRCLRMSLSIGISEFGSYCLRHSPVATQQVSCPYCKKVFKEKPLPSLTSITATQSSPQSLLLRLRTELEKPDKEAQESLLVSLGTIGTKTDEGAIPNVILLILFTLLDSISTSKDGTIRYIAMDQLNLIAKSRGKSLKDLLKEKAVFIVWGLLPRFSAMSEAEDILSSTLHVEKLVSDALPEILPVLVHECVSEQEIPYPSNSYRRALYAIAERFKSIPVMCFDNIHTILPHFLLHSDLSSFSAIQQISQSQSIAFLDNLTNNSLREIVNSYITPILTEITLLLSDDSIGQNAKQLFTAILCIIDECEPKNQDQKLSKLLGDKFLAIMDFLGKKFKDQMQREKILKCLSRILPFIGPKVSIQKIIAFLKSAILTRDSTILLEVCKVFGVYLRLIDISLLNQVDLSSIVSILLSAIPSVTSEAVRVLEFLLLEHKAQVVKFYPDLPYIPEIDATKGIREAIREQCPINWKEDVKRLLGNLQQGKTDTLETLVRLKDKLASNKKELNDAVLGDDSFLNSLMKQLLICCREPSETTQMICSECLGEIGAIDPGRVNIALRLEYVAEEFESQELGIRLIRDYLVPALRKNIDNRQDGVAYAIQEVFAALDCRLPRDCPTPSKKVKQILDRFPSDIKSLLGLYLYDNYHINTPTTAPQTSNEPIFHTGISYRKWIIQWVTSLFTMITNAPCHKVFIPCAAIVNYEMPTIVFLLPLLVHSAMKYGTDQDRKRIIDEMIAVLQSPSDSGEQCAQVIFNLYDWLNKWLEGQRIEEKKQGSRHSRKKEIGLIIQTFTNALNTIPQLSFAQAAHRYGSHARALLHFENNFRAEKEKRGDVANEFLKEHLLFLKSIFTSLEDPDSSAGISKMRKMNATRIEMISDYESSGRWNEAITLYDQEIRVRPEDITLRIGRLNCMRELGHLDVMLSLAQGEISSATTTATAQPITIQQNTTSNKQAFRSPSPKMIDSSITTTTTTTSVATVLAKPSIKVQSTRDQLISCGVQAAWRLGDWRKLDDLISIPNCASDWEISIGRSLSALKAGNKELFAKCLSEARRNILPSLSSSSFESYQRCYPDLVKLHILKELEQNKAFSVGGQASVLNEWRNRLEVTQATFKAREPILNVRRLLYQINDLEDQGRVWLQIAKLARRVGNFQTARNATQQASALKAPGQILEEAKLLWIEGEQLGAIESLTKFLERQKQLNTKHLPTRAESSESLTPLMGIEEEIPEVSESVLIQCRAGLLLSRWSEQTGAYYKETSALYHEAKKKYRYWEKSYFFLGRYYDSFILTEQQQQQLCPKCEKESQQTTQQQQQQQQQQQSHKTTQQLPQAYGNPQIVSSAHYVVNTIKNYCWALVFGNRFLYSSLPRLLTLWFNLGTESKIYPNAVERFSKANRIVDQLRQRTPAYIWLPAISQLKSRVCHVNKNLSGVLVNILSKVIQEHPQQALWSMVGLSKSAVKERAKAARFIFEDAAKNSKTVEKLDDELAVFSTNLLALCDYKVPETKPKTIRLSLRNIHTREVKNLGSTHDLSLIVPILSSFNVFLPVSGKTEPHHNPFPNSLPCISGVEDEVDIMNSLAKPKKVWITTNTGERYPFLCKPQDDMRRDARMMEIFSLINKILKQNPDASRRKLYIRCYCVVPLNEESGLIEWVQNTSGLRNIFNDLHPNPQLTQPQIKEKWEASVQKEKLFNDLCTIFPVVFYKWFLEQFPDPALWYEARNAYTRTSAVMSMVGFVTGIGDRHGENILFDSKSGDTMHVDFNCLFWKGETFQVPEKVPFRLTRNMVDAMGILGYEGAFRRSCEITLQLLRSNSDSLMSVLESFVYDPLLEWNDKDKKTQKTTVVADSANQNGIQVMKRVNEILRGKQIFGLPLSVENQVDHVLQDATSISKLSEMYVGWAPWI